MALSASMQWDVRTTGSDTNGGGFDPVSGTPGTDYSQQDTAQITYTDLVIGSTNTQLTSAGNPFTAAHVGNVINVTGGTGFTTGRYQVMSVASGVATMDRAVGTASSTGGAGKLGGAFQTIGAAATQACLYVAGNVVHVKAGTYTITSQISLSNSLTGYVYIIGYQTTHMDMGTKPLITTATNSVNIVSHNTGAHLVLVNLSMSSTAATRGNGVSADAGNRNMTVHRCIFDGFHRAINGDWTQVFVFALLNVSQTEIKNSTEDGIVNNNGGTTYFYDSYIHNNAGNGMSDKSFGSAPTIWAEYTIFSANGAAGLSLAGPGILRLRNCEFNLNTSHGFVVAGTGVGSSGHASIRNCIFYGNGGWGINFPAGVTSATLFNADSVSNAYGANTSGNKNNFTDLSPVTLTGNPFNNSGAGDFSLNSTAGAGAACKGAGYPGSFPGATSTGALDIGAIQSAAGGGGGSSAGGSYTFLH